MVTYFKPKIKSRHPSHDILRNKSIFPLFNFKSIIRLGSFTDIDDTISNGGDRVEINTIEAIKNSADKLLMKQCFSNKKVKTADWFTIEFSDRYIYYKNSDTNIGSSDDDEDPLKYPIIAKHRLGSKGRGNYKLNSKQELINWLESRKDRLGEYIFEKFYNYVREYRLHVSEDGCFYTCRKVLKKDTPNKDKWYRNDEHCNWIRDNNDLFDKPINWSKIARESVKALKAVGLDFGAIDLKIQSAKDKEGNKRKDPEFIIIEINSAPSFGLITARKYIEQLPYILLKKYNKYKKEIEDE